MTSFYEQYNCQTKEELYKKVINKDKDVESLIEFMEYAKENYKQKGSIVSPEHLHDEIKDYKIPQGNESLTVFVNTKNIPVFKGYVDLYDKDEQKRFLKDGLNSGGATALIAIQGQAYMDNDHNSMKEMLNSAGVNVLDTFVYHDNDETYKTEKDLMRTSFPHKIEQGTRKQSAVEYGLSYQREFNEFASYMTKNELQGKNVVLHNDEIRDQLKLGYQYESQEVFGLATYDEDNEIIQVRELFKGGNDASLVDSRIVAKEVLNDIYAKGFMIYHNHPSGKSGEPSEPDHQMTSKIKQLSLNIDTEMIDHYIIGKEQVYSFAENGWLDTGNKEYRAKLSAMPYQQKSNDKEMDI